MFKKIYLALIVVLFSSSLFAQEMTAQDRFINKKIMAFMQNYTIPGVAVILYVNGQPYEYYYGFADSEKNNPIIKKTIFEIGTLSKIMTSVLFAQEIDWAKMAFTDAISKYIKDLPKNYDNITLQNLATYTSGLPLNIPENISNQEELKKYLNHFFMVKPNQQLINSNLSMAMLGIALENSTESDFGDLYRRHILNPLKMINGVTIPKVYDKYYAQGFDMRGRPVSQVPSDIFPSIQGIKASVADMQNFLSAAIGLPGTPTRVFYPMRMTQSMYVKTKNGYQGLSWLIHNIEKNNLSSLLNAADQNGVRSFAIQETYDRPLYNGEMLIDQTGRTDGFRSYIAVIPAKLSGIVILTNKDVPEKSIIQTARAILFKTTKLV